MIDNRVVVAGSMNYTQPANLYNDENVFVIGSPYALSRSKGGAGGLRKMRQHFTRRALEHSV